MILEQLFKPRSENAGAEFNTQNIVWCHLGNDQCYVQRSQQTPTQKNP